jgi:hypothetical protein
MQQTDGQSECSGSCSKHSILLNCSAKKWLCQQVHLSEVSDSACASGSVAKLSVWSCACGYISFPPIFISLRLKTDSDQQRGRLKLDICSSRRELLLNLLVRATLLSNYEIDVANTAVLLIEDGWATTCDDLYHEE